MLRLPRTSDLRTAPIWRAVSVFLAVVLVPAGAVPARQAPQGDGLAASPAPPAFDSTSLETLRNRLAGIVAESPVHGVAVALVSADGTRWSEGFGVTDPATGEPVGPRTLFRANSVSKTLVALAAMRMVEEGALTLSTPLRDAAPGVEFGNRWEATDPVTVAHLLEHTSGFDELRFREYVRDPEGGALSAALAENPAPRQSRWAPGAWMAYNNGGYAVAARVLEVAADRPFDEVVRAEVLEPLGMTSSGFGLESVDRTRLTRHFLAPDSEEPPAPYPTIVRPAGALITSADDLAAVVGMLLRRGTPLLSAASVERMEMPTTSRAARAGLDVGYGLGIYGEIDAGARWLGHAGGTPSAWARYAYRPEAGVGYVVLMNGADGATHKRIERALRDFLTAPAKADALPAFTTATDTVSDLDAYIGIYRPAASPWSLTAGVERLLGGRRVRIVGGRLVMEPFPVGPPDTLISVGGDRFATGDDGFADVVFLRSDGGPDGDGPVAALVAWDAENIRAANLVRSSAVASWAPLLALGLGLPILLGSVLVAPIRSVIARVRRRDRSGSAWARRLPPLAAASLVAALAFLVAGVAGADGVLALGRKGWGPLGFWLGTWSFAVLTVAALAASAVALVRQRGPGTWARAGSFCVALSCAAVLLVLSAWGLIGLRTWAW